MYNITNTTAAMVTNAINTDMILTAFGRSAAVEQMADPVGHLS